MTATPAPARTRRTLSQRPRDGTAADKCVAGFRNAGTGECGTTPGIYSFSDVPAGTYFVASVCSPFGQPFLSCPGQDRGGDDTLDGDFGPPGHGTADFALPADGSIDLDAGFGNFPD